MLRWGILNRNSELFWTNGLNFDYRMIDVKLFSGLECRERYPTIFRHGPISGTFRGPRGTWNLETIRVWYLIWSIFWDKWPKFSVWHSFWGPYFCYQSRSGMKPSCLDCFNFYRLGPEFRQNSEHFLKKMPRNWTLDSGTWKHWCTRGPPVRTRSWLNYGCEDLLFQIYYKLIGPMNFEWMDEGQAKPSWITEVFTLLLIPNIQWKYGMLERNWSYSYFLVFDNANKTFSIFPSKAKLGLGG